MRWLEGWLTLVGITTIIVITGQTLWGYRQLRRESKQDAMRRHPTSQYHGWDLNEASKDVEPIGSIDELRIPGLSVDEADEFWHAVNDE